MAEEDFKKGFIKFGNSAVYFIFDIACVLRYFLKYGAIAMAPLLHLPMYLDYSIQK